MKIFSGIQPTGEIHIGNYLGAIKHWVKLQETQECIFSIVDLHSLTTPYNPEILQKKILELTIAHLAVGINPEKSIFFVQSRVKEHTELCWLLNTVCPVGDLSRMTQYKEKTKQFKKNINAGLLNYPVLQAADILLYKTEIVPIGEDQKQHIELTRTIAKKFNTKFGETFKIPEPQLPKIGAKIMALNDPTKKMSKSMPESCLFLFDEPDKIKKRIMSAITDTDKTIKYDIKNKPGISNLLTIYHLFSNKPIQEIEKEFEGKGYGDFKKELVELLTESLKPFREKRKELLNQEALIQKILNNGAKKAKIVAQATMEDVRKKMGLI